MPSAWSKSSQGARTGSGKSGKPQRQQKTKTCKPYVTCVNCEDRWTYVGKHNFCDYCGAPFPNWEEHEQRGQSQQGEAAVKSDTPLMDPVFRTIIDGLADSVGNMSKVKQQAVVSVMQLLRKAEKDDKSALESQDQTASAHDPVAYKAYKQKKTTLQKSKTALEGKVNSNRENWQQAISKAKACEEKDQTLREQLFEAIVEYNEHVTEMEIIFPLGVLGLADADKGNQEAARRAEPMTVDHEGEVTPRAAPPTPPGVIPVVGGINGLYQLSPQECARVIENDAFVPPNVDEDDFEFEDDDMKEEYLGYAEEHRGTKREVDSLQKQLDDAQKQLEEAKNKHSSSKMKFKNVITKSKAKESAARAQKAAEAARKEAAKTLTQVQHSPASEMQQQLEEAQAKSIKEAAAAGGSQHGDDL